MKTTTTTVLSMALTAFVSTGTARASDVQETYKSHCAMCHGPDLTGQTKAGQMLNVPDLTAPAVRVKFDRAHLIQAVTDGVKDEAGKQRMKGFGDKLSSADIASLVDYVIAGGK